MAHVDEDYDEHYIKGAHGTLAEQKDEAYYDDRSDADDDLEKGRIRFPQGVLYGRDRELKMLRNIYNGLADSFTHDGNAPASMGNTENGAEVKEKKDEKAPIQESLAPSSSDPYGGSRVIFLSGYSGIGKSALIKGFGKHIKSKYESSNTSPIILVSGKYTGQKTASAPFSAISEIFERLSVKFITRVDDGNEKGHHDSLRTKLWNNIEASDIIGPQMEGNNILRATFPALAPLLDRSNEDSAEQKKSSDDNESNNSTIAQHPSMNAIKSCTHEILLAICKTLDHPLVMFLDDLQWADDASIDLLDLLLSSTKLRNIMFICSYRSNEVDTDHPFTKLMESITKARSESAISNDPISKPSVEKIGLFSLSPESITKFIADSVKREEATKEVAELAEAVYSKTMGNIFFVMQALEELVRKNVLFYDVMYFEWRWVVSKIELANYMSDDVVETVKGKIRDLSGDIQHLLIVLSYMPNAVDVPILKSMMSCGDFMFETSQTRDLLKEASDEGMLIYSIEAGNYAFAHDRIREASNEIATEKDQNELLQHMSQVLLEEAAQRGPEMEWCLYVAADILNSLPYDKTSSTDLIGLNMKVSRIAKCRGSMGRENELLLKALECLHSSGITWKVYGITLEIYNALILSEYYLGSYDRAMEYIDQVLKNAKTRDDKLQAYLYQLLSKQEVTPDFPQGVKDGIKILNLYGFEIPATITTKYKVMEKIKFKAVLRNRSYSCLTKLPLKENLVFFLLSQVVKYANFSLELTVSTILSWKAIRYAIKNGMDSHLPIVTCFFAISLSNKGKLKSARELGNVSIALAEKIHDNKEISAFSRVLAIGAVLTQFQSFRSVLNPLMQCHNELKFVGGSVDATLGSMLGYFHSYFAAGLELGPLLESRLVLTEELSRDLNRPGFATSFQILLQTALNLRTRTKNPTELEGGAFREKEALDEMDGARKKMALRDSSSLRLLLAFLFWNEETMAQMLGILRDYPIKETVVSRLHIRLCFTGLASFALGKKNDTESLLKLGQNCLSHFEHLTKYGSVNAKPVHLFMLAMKGPGTKTFKKAIDACAEANMPHLEAMARERYASFLREEGLVAFANEYITSSYWLYQDWGAHAKALQLSQQHDFLEHAKRDGGISTIGSTTQSTSFTFNTTLRTRNKMKVKH